MASGSLNGWKNKLLGHVCVRVGKDEWWTSFQMIAGHYEAHGHTGQGLLGERSPRYVI